MHTYCTNTLTQVVICAEPIAGKQHALVAGSWDTLLSVWLLRPYWRSKDAAILPSSPSHYLHGHDDRCAPAQRTCLASAMLVTCALPFHAE